MTIFPTLAATLLLVATAAPIAVATTGTQVAPIQVLQPSGQSDFADVLARPASEWQRIAHDDVQAFAEAARQNYIYAAYPEPDLWSAEFARTVSEVEAMTPLVQDAAGYQAVLRYLAVTFRDTHVGVQFSMPPVAPRWPGFLIRYDNGRYRVTSSEADGVAHDAELTACDGKPVAQWIDTITRYEISTPTTLGTTRMSAALRLMIDRGSPLRSHPSRCEIDGREVRLDWRAAQSDALTLAVRSMTGFRERNLNMRMIGEDGAWVTLPYFSPANAEQASAFHAAIAAAPSLREKRFIVLDVRGNPGGPYNWFMGYLRGLYGAAYADHYATSRLNIRGVYRLSPAYVALDDALSAEEDAFNTPADPPFEINDAIDDEALILAKAAGAPFFRAAPITVERGTPPPSPVRAKVYVLTDYGCGSACIAFVDELKHFPGVEQIGLPTHVDSRSGTPVWIEMPSGNASAYIATMTRDNRPRGDNVDHIPSLPFSGDIRDDEAVESWIVDELVGRDTEVASEPAGK